MLILVYEDEKTTPKGGVLRMYELYFTLNCVFLQID